MISLIVFNECTNGAIDEKIIMLVYYEQNGCILLVLKYRFYGLLKH